MKIYQYSNKQIFMKFFLAFAIMVSVFLSSLYQVILLGKEFNWLYFCFIVCVPIILFKEFITLDHPTKIITDAEGIRFVFLNTSHYYKWEEIDSLFVKQYGRLSDTVMIFINKPNLLRGKYWISKNSFVNCDELINELKKVQCIS